MSNGWIGVDLDGTLAYYDHWRGPDHIGEPVPEMLERVLAWLAAGKDVRIFTARVSSTGTEERDAQAAVARLAIRAWCIKHLNRPLKITNVKDYAMIELYDDRAIQVVQNQGRLVS